jgi:hypothetical protein
MPLQKTSGDQQSSASSGVEPVLGTPARHAEDDLDARRKAAMLEELAYILSLQETRPLHRGERNTVAALRKACGIDPCDAVPTAEPGFGAGEEWDLTLDDLDGSANDASIIEALSLEDKTTTNTIPVIKPIVTETVEPAEPPSAPAIRPVRRSEGRYPLPGMSDATDNDCERAITGEPNWSSSGVCRGGNVNDIDELLAELGGGDGLEVDAANGNPIEDDEEAVEAHVSELASSKIVSARKPCTPSTSSATGSKIVSAAKRRSLENDTKIVAKMRSFHPSDISAAAISSVMESPPSNIKPANDNVSIPVWSLTGDLVTAVCAALALQLYDNPAIAFTHNLTPEAIDTAKRNPNGFVDYLKRRLDQNLARAGIALPYFFAVDVDHDDRLHIHGGFRYPLASRSFGMERRIRRIFKQSFGAWTGPGKHKQLHFQSLYSDDWATYCLRNSKAAQRIIGPRSFTISRELGREAKSAYGQIRAIMRGEM